jgi:hypothetical protein
MQNSLIVKDDIEQRFMHQDAAVYSIKPQFAEAIHEETDARWGRPDRFILGDTSVPYDWEYGDHAGKS